MWFTENLRRSNCTNCKIELASGTTLVLGSQRSLEPISRMTMVGLNCETADRSNWRNFVRVLPPMPWNWTTGPTCSSKVVVTHCRLDSAINLAMRHTKECPRTKMRGDQAEYIMGKVIYNGETYGKKIMGLLCRIVVKFF